MLLKHRQTERDSVSGVNEGLAKKGGRKQEGEEWGETGEKRIFFLEKQKYGKQSVYLCEEKGDWGLSEGENVFNTVALGVTHSAFGKR